MYVGLSKSFSLFVADGTFTTNDPHTGDLGSLVLVDRVCSRAWFLDRLWIFPSKSISSIELGPSIQVLRNIFHPVTVTTLDFLLHGYTRPSQKLVPWP